MGDRGAGGFALLTSAREMLTSAREMLASVSIFNLILYDLVYVLILIRNYNYM
jgi:hypothetical protein